MPPKKVPAPLPTVTENVDIPLTLPPPDFASLGMSTTPSNNMSSSHASSGGFEDSIEVPFVAPWIERDIAKHDQCDFDKLLEYFFGRLAERAPGDGETVSGHTLLHQCLQAIIPICNAERPNMKTMLKSYIDARPERKRYDPLVTLLQAADGQLEEIQVDGLPGIPDPDDPSNPGPRIVYHANDKPMWGSHNTDFPSERKPDIVGTSDKAAMRVSEEPNEDNPQIKHLTQAPRYNFEWFDALLAWEVKVFLAAKQSPKVPRGPYKYTPAPMQPGIEPCSDVRSMPSTTPRKRSATPWKAPLNPATSPAGSANSRVNSPSGSSAPHSQPRKDKDIHSNQPPPLVQCALYGTEMLCSSPGVSHAINLVVVDHVVWIWWYDRQGAIQSSGIDFFQDLPRFLALLLAFQRFTFEDWGIIPELNPLAVAAHRGKLNKLDEKWKGELISKDRTYGEAPSKFKLSFEDETKEKEKEKKEKEKKREKIEVDVTVGLGGIPNSRYTLRGRATWVLDATPASSNSKKYPAKLVVKISWPDEERESEASIIEKATTHAEDEDIKGHLPVVVCSSELKHSTKTIRDALGIVSSDSATRSLRATVFVHLENITSLQGEDFVRAWVDCVKCHYALWKKGIQHGDPSVDNLMVNDDKRGVLNDWDLAKTSTYRKRGVERTGTIPFMAIELLTDAYWRGEIERKYRHDNEGFIWILVWVFLQYRDGKIVNYQLKRWQTGDYITCAEQKDSLRVKYAEFFPTESWIDEWPIAIALLKLLNTFLTEIQSVKEASMWKHLEAARNSADVGSTRGAKPNPSPEVLTDEEVFTQFFKSIKNIVDERPQLALRYLYEIMPAGI